MSRFDGRFDEIKNYRGQMWSASANRTMNAIAQGKPFMLFDRPCMVVDLETGLPWKEYLDKQRMEQKENENA
jgi:hypothetical protein